MKHPLVAPILAALVPLAMAYLQYREKIELARVMTLEKIELARVIASACSASVEGLAR